MKKENNPILSIITINRNNAAGLRKTMESVLKQTWRDFEYIIIDGASTDESIEVIDEFLRMNSLSDVPLKITWNSEPDKGIYNAMNKGIKHVRGKYCLFMNSGDWLSSNQIIQELFSENIEADIVSCDVLFEKSKFTSEILYKSPDSINMEYFNHNSLPHQGSLIKSNLFKLYGCYDETLKVISDWVFFVDVLINHNVSYQHIKLCLAYCETEGISNNPKYSKLINKETKDSLYRLMPMHADAYILLQQYYQIDRDPQFQFFKTFRKTQLFRIIWGIYKRMVRLRNCR